ncbi:MAG TPA: hypothetical protein DDW52_03075 [Planctomycetaceae bacterium]|nr:hypothetical protein [Planctomycetaceae bacterium]
MDKTELAIRDAAVSMRRAWDEILWRANTVYEKFPKDCCTTASRILALFLREREFSPQLVRGKSPVDDDNGRGHDWVEVEGLTVDITADQFPGMPPVIVKRQSAWHEGLEGSYLPKHCIQFQGEATTHLKEVLLSELRRAQVCAKEIHFAIWEMHLDSRTACLMLAAYLNDCLEMQGAALRRGLDDEGLERVWLQIGELTLDIATPSQPPLTEYRSAFHSKLTVRSDTLITSSELAKMKRTELYGTAIRRINREWQH